MQPMTSFVIVDYGAGNIRSVQKAFQRLGHEAVITVDPQVVAEAQAVVFPGQGASPAAMASLERTGLADAIRQAVSRGTPFLGVCLGLQLLMDWSEEGDTACLGILPGAVRRLPEGQKVPQMGWNAVRVRGSHPFFAGVPQDSHFYFVHSYYAEPREQAAVLATTSYGVEFCSVAVKDNIIATQFHPEKSGPLGLRLYDNFVRSLVKREPEARPRSAAPG